MSKLSVFCVVLLIFVPCVVLGFYDWDVRGQISIESAQNGERTPNNLRPCAADGGKNLWGNYDYFYNRCLFSSDPHNCTIAWELFSEVFNNTAGYQDASPPNYTQFIEYFDWKSDMVANNLQPIFYSGAGKCPDIVHQLTNVSGVGLITLEDQTGPYSVANGAWCTQAEFDPATGNCPNNTVWGRNPNGYFGNNTQTNYGGASFWIPASERFGTAAYGTVWAMLRSSEASNTSIHYGAFSFGTVFADVEFPSIRKQPQVTGFSVIVITNAVQPTETCGSGSLELMKSLANQTWPGKFECYADPPCVLQFLCNEQLPSYLAVNITNRDIKCGYFSALQGTADALTNCKCNTDTVTTDGNGNWFGQGMCPSISIVSDTTTGVTTSEPATTTGSGSDKTAVIAWMIAGLVALLAF